MAQPQQQQQSVQAPAVKTVTGAAQKAPAAPQSQPGQQAPAGVDSEPSEGEGEAVGVDYTKIPAQLDKKFLELDEDSALRPTIIKTGDYWSRSSKKSLLAEPSTATLSTEQQGKERSKAFDLLDALTKSGALSIEMAALHVVIAATHCFDKTLMNTLVQDNVNPIEKVERSSLIVASTIHGVTPRDLIASEHIERVSTYSPMLIEDVDESVPVPTATEKEKEKEAVKK